MRFFLPLVLFLSAAGWGAAQTTERDVMVVFDMSGSMWGQVDGVAKVEIARDAFDGLLADWDANGTRAGLVAYGHRERGNCADIEVLAKPDDGFDIAALVAELSPIGKTPLSDAVRQAAEVLRFTEEAATVVLLSDGVETCAADPCAVGAELEALGLDFTAHVIGFDIAEGDKAQLQCLANATGGQYFDAADAGELAAAMDGVIQATVSTTELPALHNLTLRVTGRRDLQLPDDITVYAGDTALGSLTDATATIPGLPVSLPLGPVTLRADGRDIYGVLEADITTDTDILVINVDAVQADYVLSRQGQFPILPAGGEHYIMVKNTTGVDRSSFYHTYLYPLGSTDEALRIRGGNMAPDADQFNLTTITSPATPGDYDLVLMATSGEEYGRIPVSFASAIASVWQGPRDVEPAEVIDAQWAGPSNRSHGFQFIPADHDLSEASYSHRAGIQNMATTDGFTLVAPSEPGLYRLVFFTNVENNRTFDTVDMGLIAVGVPLPDMDGSSTDAPVDPATDPMAKETDAMGGEEGELIEIGVLHGDWRLIFQNTQRTIPLLSLSVIHDIDAPTADGSYSVTANASWGLGDSGDYGDLTLTRGPNDALTLTLVSRDGTVTIPLTASDIGWHGEITTADDVATEVKFLKVEDLSAVETAADQAPVELFVLAEDERGNRISTRVSWTVQSIATQTTEQFDTDDGRLRDAARTPGSYVITAQTDDLIGSYTVVIGRGQPAGNTLVLKPAGEGDDLALDVAYYCSEGEVCEMHLSHMPISFTLPVGWGAERPIYTAQFEPMFNMTINTADGPFFATLNQQQRMAELGPCMELVTGTFCHDTTDDPALLADIALIQRSLSFKPAGIWLDDDRFDTLLNQLTGEN